MTQIARERFPDLFPGEESLAAMASRVLVFTPRTSQQLLQTLQASAVHSTVRSTVHSAWHEQVLPVAAAQRRSPMAYSGRVDQLLAATLALRALRQPPQAQPPCGLLSTVPARVCFMSLFTPPPPPPPPPLQTLESTIIDHRVRLVVLDSVASLARADFAPGSLPERQRMLGQQVRRVLGGWAEWAGWGGRLLRAQGGLACLIGGGGVVCALPSAAACRMCLGCCWLTAAHLCRMLCLLLLSVQASRLKYLAEAFSIPILVTNQVTTYIGDSSGGGGGHLTAALGTLWAHAVNTRLVLESVQGA